MSKKHFLARYGDAKTIHRLIDIGESPSIDAAKNRNPAWGKEHTDRLLASENSLYRRSGLTSKLATVEQLEAAKLDPDEHVRRTAHFWHAKRLTGDQIVDIVNNHQDPVVQKTVFNAGNLNSKFTVDHYRKMADHPDSKIRDISKLKGHL